MATSLKVISILSLSFSTDLQSKRFKCDQIWLKTIRTDRIYINHPSLLLRLHKKMELWRKYLQQLKSEVRLLEYSKEFQETLNINYLFLGNLIRILIGIIFLSLRRIWIIKQMIFLRRLCTFKYGLDRMLFLKRRQ